MKKKLNYTIIEQPSTLDFFSNDALTNNEMNSIAGGFDCWDAAICFGRACDTKDCSPLTCTYTPCPKNSGTGTPTPTPTPTPGTGTIDTSTGTGTGTSSGYFSF